MKAYRIGRKPMGPWTNMTPPIRGGIYRRPSISPSDDCPTLHVLDAALSDDGASTGCDHVIDLSPCLARKPVAAIRIPGTADPEKTAGLDHADEKTGLLAAAGDEAAIPNAPVIRMSPEQYTDWAVQQEIEQGLRDYPSLDPMVQQDIVARYRLMHQQVIDQGLYECHYIEYAKEMTRYSILFSLFLVTLHYCWYLTSAVFLGLFWVRLCCVVSTFLAACSLPPLAPMLTCPQHQIMFTAHDAGHRAITKNFVLDTLIGLFVADFCCGLSIGWWKRSHNVHHLITNHPEHDPDIQNLPIFATCPSFFRSIFSTYYDFAFKWDAVADFLVPYQNYTYYPIMGVARFNLYLLSWMHVLSSKSSALGNSKAWWIRPAEIASMACFWFIFGYCLVWRSLPTWTIRVLFVLVSHIVTMPLHVQITLSHWGMSTSELGESESFAQRQLRTTMDVDCPRWLDFIHGGLQFQAMHHLFPRVPRHNLRRVQDLGIAFSRDTGIPYTIFNFVDGNRKVISRLGEVGDQVRILVQCQKYMAETRTSGLH